MSSSQAVSGLSEQSPVSLVTFLRSDKDFKEGAYYRINSRSMVFRVKLTDFFVVKAPGRATRTEREGGLGPGAGEGVKLLCGPNPAGPRARGAASSTA